MRDSPVRYLALLLLTLALATPVVAQENATTNETNETVVGNETPTGNETGGTNDTTEEPAEEEPAGPITIEIEGYQEGGATYFTLKGETQRNPTIRVQPGQEVTFIFTSVSGFHNLNVDGEAKTSILGPGNSETIEWTAPAEGGSLEYWCDPHRGAGMRGTIQVGGAADGGGGDDGGTITGETIDLGQYDPACAGRVAPAAAAEGIVGMPTLQDYIDACTPNDGGAERASSGADYVIPISWGLIGLGVVGVVWVHKYYKP